MSTADAPKYRVEKQEYSRGKWRVLDSNGNQVWQQSTYAMRLPNGRYENVPIHVPVCFDRKRDAAAWIEARQ